MPAREEVRCQYVHSAASDRIDPRDENTLSPTGEGSWRCPHYVLAAQEGSNGEYDYCPFHMGTVGDTSGIGRPPPLESYLSIALGDRWDADIGSEYSEKILSYVEYAAGQDALSNLEAKQAIGATFGGGTVDYAVVEGASNAPLDLRGATFEGEVSLQHATVGHAIWLDDAEFQRSVLLTEAEFGSRVRFNGAEFQQGLSAGQATFTSWAEFGRANVSAELNFRGATFHDGIFAVEMVTNGPADFMNTEFLDVANFTEAVFNQGVLFSSTTFGSNGMFRKAEFTKPVGLCESLVDGTNVNDRWRNLAVTDRTVPDCAIVVRNVTCSGSLRFEEATFVGEVPIVSSRIEGDLLFEDVETKGTPVFDLTETSVVSGVFVTEKAAEFDFFDAVVGDIEDIEPAPSQLRFDRTDFDQFDFGKHRDLFRDLNWNLGDSSTSAPARENMYLRAKNGATQMGENTVASRFHYKEADERGRSYFENAVARFNSRDLAHTAVYARRWIGNRFLKYSCGYGEKPGRVFLSSVGIVLFYAIVYALIDIPVTYQGPLSPLVLSIDSFGAIILGLPSVSNSTVGLIVASEAFLGPFFVALLVFDLTQSISR